MKALSSLIAIAFISFAAWANASPITRPHFYTIASRDGRVSYILGTIHGGVSLSELPAGILQRFNGAKTLVNEWEFTVEETNRVLQNRVVEDQLKNFKHRGDELSDEIRVALVRDWGLDPRLAAKAKSEDCSLLTFGGPIQTGWMDFRLLDMARQQKKKIVPLDTDALIDKAVKASTRSCDLRRILGSMTAAQFRQSQNAMIEQYRSGEAVVEDDALVTVRNEVWVQKLLPTLNEGSAFIAVGFGHLYGQQGLLELLKRNGFTISSGL